MNHLLNISWEQIEWDREREEWRAWYLGSRTGKDSKRGSGTEKGGWRPWKLILSLYHYQPRALAFWHQVLRNDVTSFVLSPKINFGCKRWGLRISSRKTQVSSESGHISFIWPIHKDTIMKLKVPSSLNRCFHPHWELNLLRFFWMTNMSTNILRLTFLDEVYSVKTWTEKNRRGAKQIEEKVTREW